MKGKFLLTISLAGMMAVVFPLKLLADKTDKQYEHAHKTFDKGDLENARRELEEILRTKPDFEKAKILLSLTYYLLSQKSVGVVTVAQLREALRLDPDEAYWHSELAKQLNALGAKEEAIKECAHAATLSPDDSGLAAGCGLNASENSENRGPENQKDKAKAGDHVFGLGGDVSPPQATHRPEPPYSEKARLISYQGDTALFIIVNERGDVEQERIVKPLGLGLDECALRTVHDWKFKPATRNGTPVPTRVILRLTFRVPYG